MLKVNQSQKVPCRVAFASSVVLVVATYVVRLVPRRYATVHVHKRLSE